MKVTMLKTKTVSKKPIKKVTPAKAQRAKTTKKVARKPRSTTLKRKHSPLKRLHIRITQTERLSFASLLLLAGIIGTASVFAVITYAASTTRSTLYVSTKGSDQNVGTAEKPLATLAKALEKTSSNGIIELADGAYPMTDVSRGYAGLIVRGSSTGATVAGLNIKGASRAEFRNLNFSGPVKMENGNSKLTKPAANLLFDGNRHDLAFKTVCFRIVNGTHDITIKNSNMIRCNNGIVGPGRVDHSYRSYNINVLSNVIDRTQADGMQFGDWDNVVIAGNSITNNGVGDVPKEEKFHPDAIQITGRSSNITIRDNKIGPARSQAMMVQSSIGPVDNVKVSNNRIGHANGVAYQNIGVSRLVITKNVICGNDGGLWIKAAANNPIKNDAIVTDNIIQMEAGSNTFNLYAPATISGKSSNLGGIKTNTGNTLQRGTCDAAALTMPTAPSPGSVSGPGAPPVAKQQRTVSAPSNVAATPAKDGTIAVAWQWAGANPNRFQIVLNGKAYGNPDGASRSATITGLANGSVNTVKVLAEFDETDVYLKGISGFNPESGLRVIIPEKVAMPTDVALVQTGPGKITLKWKYVTTPGVKYRIYMGDRRLATMDSTARSYTMTGRPVGVENKLVITAIDYDNGAVESKPTVVTLTPTY